MTRKDGVHSGAITYATLRDTIRYDDYPETGQLSERQSRSHWSDMVRYTINDTTEGRDHFRQNSDVNVSIQN
jgi:hypothetical protein